MKSQKKKHPGINENCVIHKPVDNESLLRQIKSILFIPSLSVIIEASSLYRHSVSAGFALEVKGNIIIDYVSNAAVHVTIKNIQK